VELAVEDSDNAVKFNGNVIVHYRSQHDENLGNRDGTGFKSTRWREMLIDSGNVIREHTADIYPMTKPL